jgi:predicted dehydrogenase/GT2 family glycosyltransferase
MTDPTDAADASQDNAPVSDAADGPAFSVVLVAVAGYDIIARTVAALRRQTIASRIELLLMSPNPDGLALPSQLKESFYQVRVIDIGDERRVGAIRARGIREAGAPIVAMSEDHCFPYPDWAQAMLEAHGEGVAVVGPAMVNANPGTPQSWAAMIIAYAPWTTDPEADPGPPQDVAFLPGHNSSYHRQTVLEVGDALDTLMSSEVVLHWRLHAQGRRIVLAPRARGAHVNVTSTRALSYAMFHHARMFGALRAASTGGLRRLIYLATTPLVPPLRLWRSRSAVRSLTPPGVSRLRVLTTLAPVMVVSALGEALGLARGRGRSDYEDWDIELDRAKLIRPQDQHLLDAPTDAPNAPPAPRPITGRAVRVGVLGCGKLTREVHLPLLARMPGVSVAAVADPDERARAAASKLAPEAAAYHESSDLLSHDGLDAVLIAAPTAQHAALAIAAFDAGLHVYLEKPLADNLDDADAVLAAQQRSGRLGMIGFNYRHHPGYTAMRRAVITERIGKPVHVRSVFTTGAALMQGAAWRARRSRGGGALLDLFSHEADLIAFVVGQPITEVQAQLGSRTGEGDTATVEAVTRTGVRVQGFYAFGVAEQAVLTVTGERGQVSLDRYGGLRIEQRGEAAPGPIGRTLSAVSQWRGWRAFRRKRRSPWGDPTFEAALRRFVDAVAAGTAPRPGLLDGRSSLAVVAAAEASANRGQAEPVSFISASSATEAVAHA